MYYKPLSGRDFPRFSAIKTFFRLPQASLTENFDLALFGIPFDSGVSYRPGARFAPTKVREMTSLGRGFHWEHEWNLFQKLKIADIGDCPIVPIDLESTYSKIETFTDQIYKNNKRFVAVGGDHSVTLPLLRAARKKAQEPLSLIHFDAHLDTYPAAWGCEYHHGSFARHAIIEGLVDPKRMFQIGIRGPFAGADDLDFARQHGINLISTHEIKSKGPLAILQSLPEIKGPSYLTFDIDCLDPAFAPGTGTPVPGGLYSYETLETLKGLRLPHLLGADLVEVCPAYDQGEITSLLGSSILFEILNLFILAN